MELKSDLFGTVTRVERAAPTGAYAVVVRDTRAARWWTKSLARRLAQREARALRLLAGTPGVPQFESLASGVLVRTWIEGRPMQLAQPRDPTYFRCALALVRRLHRAGVAHNDLAKEPNWLVTLDGNPALVDFQLALVSRRRGRLFRMLARDDLRHLMKHKRTYCAQALTARQRALLAAPSPIARLWMASGKKVYTFVTRRILGWADREGAGDRQFRD